MVRLNLLAPADRAVLDEARRVGAVLRTGLGLLLAIVVVMAGALTGAGWLERQITALHRTAPDRTNPDASLTALRAEVNERANLLKESLSAGSAPLEVFAASLAAIPAGVSLNAVNLDGQAHTLTLTGTAANRGDVVTFTAALEDETGVVRVEAPLSSLAPRTNVPFTVLVTLTP